MEVDDAIEIGVLGKDDVEESVGEELEVGPGDALVEVEACGLCHTDLGFANGSVAPRHALPLVLGDEVAGVVVGGPLARKRVLVLAVMSCGDCALCRAGRGNACLKQTMPGNDANGGFATHVVAPVAALVVLDPPEVLDLIWRGSVVLEPFVERAPMSKINDHLRALAEHALERRLVLDPRS